MHITPNSPSTIVADSPRGGTRRTASPRPQVRKENRRFSRGGLLLALLMFVVGMGTGALLMRQRYKGQQVVFAVNGTTVDRDTLYRRLEQAAGARVARQIAGEELRLQFAKKIGALPTPAQVDAAYAEAQKQAGFDKALADSGLKVEEIKRTLLLGLTSNAILARNTKVSDAEVRKFYADNSVKNNPCALFYTPETVQLAVIMTKTETQARAAYRALRDISFQAAAKKFSLDASKANGGLMPPIMRGRTMANKVPGLEAAAFGMKIGQLSEPRQFAGFWWIMKCVNKTAENTRRFEEVRQACETGALTRKGAAANAKSLQEELAAFRKSAKVQAFWPQYQAILTDL